jgi:hypothetical protein
MGRTHAVPGKLKPGSWADAIHQAAAAGEEVPPDAVPAHDDRLYGAQPRYGRRAM